MENKGVSLSHVSQIYRRLRKMFCIHTATAALPP
jgi:hypothetical protein